MVKFDLTGRRFGRLVVLHKTESTNKNSRWLCECDCGKEISVSRVHLRNGHTISCGCFQREQAANNAKLHKTRHGLSHTKLYKVWDGLRYRCYNPSCHAYDSYGGRGIEVCAEWRTNFEAFHGWALASGYRDGLSIDRIDNDGNYEPENCRWVTMKTQSRNRRSTIQLTVHGETRSVKEWAEIYGLPYGALQKRLRKPGADPFKALTEPLRRVLHG